MSRLPQLYVIANLNRAPGKNESARNCRNQDMTITTTAGSSITMPDPDDDAIDSSRLQDEDRYEVLLHPE